MYKILIRVILLLWVIILTTSAYSQIELPEGRYSINQMKDFGMNAERNGDTYTAIYFYEIYLNKREKNQKVLERLASLYMESRNYEMAKICYDKHYQMNVEKNIKSLYYYSLMCMSTGDYISAKEGFVQFKKKYKDFEDVKVFRKLTKNHLISCEIADSLHNFPKDISLIHLDSTINKSHIEFSPISLNKDSFIYASSFTDSLIYYEIGYSSYLPANRKFFLAVKRNKEWKRDKVLDSPFNENGVNVGNGCLTNDGNKFYFTKCNKNWKNEIICHLYVSEKNKGVWSDAKEMPFPLNHPDYSTSQPAVGYDSRYGREIIYFSSNRPEGKGGMDLWYCTYDSKKSIYKEPKNLGSKINTPGDEITPYYDMKTHTLYYSSNGLPGLGGFDVYKSLGEYRKWILPENFGAPINSNADDLYFSIGDSREDGFFTSNRSGVYELINPNCCDDIFYFTWNDYIHLAVKGQVYDIPDNYIVEMINRKFNLGKEINEERKYISGIPVQLYYEDQESNELFLISIDTTDINGEYFFDLDREKEYFVSIKNYGYFNKKLRFNTYGYKYSDTLIMNAVGINGIPKKELQFDLFYDFGESELSNEMKVHIDTTLLEIMQEISHIVVEISSHTDNLGEDEYNLVLSQKRADNVIKYLIENNINPERLSGIGYGETKPIAMNQNEDGTDNPKGREKNRRTEIKIVGSLDKYYFEDGSNENYE